MASDCSRSGSRRFPDGSLRRGRGSRQPSPDRRLACRAQAAPKTNGTDEKRPRLKRTACRHERGGIASGLANRPTRRRGPKGGRSRVLPGSRRAQAPRDPDRSVRSEPSPSARNAISRSRLHLHLLKRERISGTLIPAHVMAMKVANQAPEHLSEVPAARQGTRGDLRCRPTRWQSHRP